MGIRQVFFVLLFFCNVYGRIFIRPSFLLHL